MSGTVKEAQYLYRRLRTNRLTIPGSQLATTGSTIALSVKSQMFVLPGDATWVRFRIANNSGAAFTFKAIIAPTSQIGNGWSPYFIDGSVDTNGASFSSVTFAQAGADSTPDQYASGGVAFMDIPIGGAWSDWMPLAAASSGSSVLLPRLDATTDQRLLLFRGQATAGTGWAFGENPNSGGIILDTANTGGFSSNFTSVTGISTPSAQNYVTNSFFHAQAAQVISNKAGYTMLTIGSSVASGFTSTNNRSSWNRIAANSLSNAYGAPFSALWSSYNSNTVTFANIFAGAFLNINLFKPDFVLIQVNNRSENAGGATKAVADSCWAYVQQAVALTIKNGGIPILVTVPPFYTETPSTTEEVFRVLNNTRARTSGLIVFDLDAILTDGGNPARIRTAYNDSGDNIHAGDTGQAVAGAALQVLIANLVLRFL
jgi:hypothetical protein